MTTEEQIEVMQAFVDGKQIQFKDEFSIDWIDLHSTPSWNWVDKEYRVKPESKYIPYKDTNEMIDDYCKRFGVERKEYEEPVIWVKICEVRMQVLSFYKGAVTVGDITLKLQEIFDAEYTYLDGSPVGKLVEE